MMDSDLQSTWDSLYSCEKRDGVDKTTYHYDRAVKSQILGNDHWHLKTALGLLPSHAILLVGCGFGWVVEDWLADGLNVMGTEPSTWIHANKSTHSTVTIRQDDLSKNAGRNAIKSAFGVTGNNKIDYIISEDVMPVLSDVECVQLSGHMRDFGTNIVHWITCGTGFAPLNWKTETLWKLLLTPDLIVPRGTSRVL